MDPYTYTWQMPLEPNSTTGLGGGIVYAISRNDTGGDDGGSGGAAAKPSSRKSSYRRRK